MPSSIKHIEETLTLVKTYIQTYLQTYLTVIQTEKADGRVLTAPITTNYVIYEVGSFPNFPFIEFVGNTSDNVIAGGNWDETDHNIVIRVHNISIDGTNTDAAVRAYRFTRAIAEIIQDYRTLGGQVIGIKINNVNYAPMMTDDNIFKTEVWINCVVKHHGSFT